MAPSYEQPPLESGEESALDSTDGFSLSQSPQQRQRRWAQGAAGAAALVLGAVLLFGATRQPASALQSEGLSTDIVGLASSAADCSEDTEDCSATKCCKHTGRTCYEKNEHYANCNATCTPGINPNDAVEHQTNWSCRALGPPATGTCGTDAGSCTQSKCCQSPGFTCFQKNEHFANCNETCTPGNNTNDPVEHRTPWDCTRLGGANCSADTEDCSVTKCCKDAGYTCYAKNEHFANCNATCTPGINTNDPAEHRTPWSCDIVGGFLFKAASPAPAPAPAPAPMPPA